MRCAGQTKRMRCGDEMRRPNKIAWRGDRCAGRTKKRWRGDGMHRPKEKEEVFENEDDESLLMEHHLRREELKRDDFDQEL
jgi:hypothetical protein